MSTSKPSDPKVTNLKWSGDINPDDLYLEFDQERDLGQIDTVSLAVYLLGVLRAHAEVHGGVDERVLEGEFDEAAKALVASLREES